MKFLTAAVEKTRGYRIKKIYIKGELKMEEIKKQIKESTRQREGGFVSRIEESGSEGDTRSTRNTM
jgi:hypothetical protein